MTAVLEKTEKETLSNLVESLDWGLISISLNYDCTDEHTYVTVSVKQGEDDMIKPVSEYVESFEDIGTVVSNYIQNDLLRFARYNESMI